MLISFASLFLAGLGSEFLLLLKLLVKVWSIFLNLLLDFLRTYATITITYHSYTIPSNSVTYIRLWKKLLGTDIYGYSFSLLWVVFLILKQSLVLYSTRRSSFFPSHCFPSTFFIWIRSRVKLMDILPLSAMFKHFFFFCTLSLYLFVAELPCLVKSYQEKSVKPTGNLWKLLIKLV